MAAKSDKKKSEARKAGRSASSAKERTRPERAADADSDEESDSAEADSGDADSDEADSDEVGATEPKRPLGELLVPGTNVIGIEPAAAVPEAEAATPTELGTGRYVQAAFFAGGLLAAFVAGKTLLTIWNRLAEWPAAVRAVPQLLSVGEVERGTYTAIGGVLIGIGVVIYTYRKEEVRQWANDVALELSKVTWPNREAVTNGTVVVIAASVVATLYVMLLDRFWGFLTSLIYET